jgi:predicted nucleic-acid-binding protein
VVGIDTNVLVRYFADDDPAQSRLARELLERRLTRESPGFVCATTLAEFAWVLRRLYGGERGEIADALAGVMTAANLVIEHKPQAWAALAAFRAGPAGFSDCLIAQINRAAGCDTTWTFDRLAVKQPGFTLLAK